MNDEEAWGFKWNTIRPPYYINSHGEIVDVIEKPLYYKVENKDINKYLLVKICKEIKEFKILFISSKPTQGLELSYYLRELTNSGIPRPTLRQIREK